MAETIYKPCFPVMRLARMLLPVYLDKQYLITANNSIIKDLKPPYLILANHVNNWDPIFVSRFVDHPIQFVTNDNFFRKKWLKFVLIRLAGAIPKTKSMSDSQAVKNILKVRNWNGVIGIFPEGSRCWDGESLTSIYSTAKLVKLLKIPVIFVKIRGAYLAGPRWAIKQRKGKVLLDYSLILKSDQIKKLSVDKIHSVIEENLKYNEYEWQKTVMYKYVTKNRAERLELLLFTCPSCRLSETLVSKENELYCTHCGYTVTYTETGFFHNDKVAPIFSTTVEWNKWQTKELYEFIEKIDDHEINIFDDNDCIFYKGTRVGVPKKIGIGRLLLTIDKIIFINEKRESVEIFLDRISGFNVQSNRIFEFYYDNVLFRFGFVNNKVSPYKWNLAVDYIKQKREDKAYE